VSIHFVYALSLLNGIGVFAAQILVSLYALHHGASHLTVGLLAASFSLFPMLLAVVAGRLVDRFGVRWPMTFGASTGGIGMLIAYFFPGLTSLFVAALLTGLGLIFINLGTQNLVGLLSKPENRSKNFSNYTLSTSAANLLGPLIGGFSIEHFGHASTSLYLALLSLGPITMLLTYGRALPGGTRVPGKGTGGGARAMLADPQVQRMLVTGSLINAGINLYQVYMPVYAHSIGLAASTIGIVVAMNSAAAFVARFALPGLIRKFGEQRLLAYVFFFGASALTLIPLFHNAVALGLVSFLFGLGMGCGQPIIIMLMFSNSRDGRSGEALGLKFTVNQMTKLISPVIFGSISTLLGLPPMFWLNATLMIAGGLFSRPRSPVIETK
jgi:MFS family permease